MARRWAPKKWPAPARPWAGTTPPFVIPDDLLQSLARRRRTRRRRTAHDWEKRLAASADKAEFNRIIAGELPANFDAVDRRLQAGTGQEPAVRSPPAIPRRTRSTSSTPAVPETIGGSADLTGSNNTKSKDLKPLTAADYGGRYIYYGIREHGMAAAMNGMALHGGVIPYGGTFLVLHRLLPAVDPPCGADGHARHLCDDP